MADEKPARSIRDYVTEAWDAAEGAEEDANPPPQRDRRPPPEEPDRDELAEGIEEAPRKQRDEKGRFLKEGEPEEPKKPAPAPAPKPEVDREAEPSPKDVAPNREQRLAKATEKWRPEQKEFLSKQSPEVQDFLIDRDAEMGAAFTRKTQRLALLESEYGPIHQMMEPDLPRMRAAGYTPRMLIEGWANCERAFLQGPQEAALTLRSIAEGYKVPRETIAHAFGFDPRTPDQIANGMVVAPSGAPQPNGHDPNAFRDPRVDTILQSVHEEQEREQIAQHQALRQRANAAQAQINEFREATDRKGNLLHPYFAEVEAHMLALAQFYGQRDGKLPSLDQLYTDAVNANPATRDKALADANAAQSEKRRAAEAARGKTEQARRAASSVTGSGRPTSRTPEPPKKGQSIRASIDAAFNEVVGDEP
jgi:hypothetical protein